MAEFQDLVSPSNSPSVRELSIVSNCDVDIIPFLSNYYKNILLPNLTILKIHHFVSKSSRDINYSTQLISVLSASPLLRRIEIWYKSQIDLDTYLDVLDSIPALPSLTALIFRHQDTWVALEASDLKGLGRIAAPNLRWLHLACNILVRGDGKEIKVAFKNMLQRLSNLVTLEIEGCFVTPVANTWAKIVLDFPKLGSLRNFLAGSKLFSILYNFGDGGANAKKEEEEDSSYQWGSWSETRGTGRARERACRGQS